MIHNKVLTFETCSSLRYKNFLNVSNQTSSRNIGSRAKLANPGNLKCELTHLSKIFSYFSKCFFIKWVALSMFLLGNSIVLAKMVCNTCKVTPSSCPFFSMRRWDRVKKTHAYENAVERSAGSSYTLLKIFLNSWSSSLKAHVDLATVGTCFFAQALVTKLIA